MLQDPNNPLLLRSVWDWGEQFPEQDIALFTNPLYEACRQSHPKELLPQGGLSSLRLWRQCYFRWLPLLEIPGGGQAQIDLQLRQLSAEVATLQRGESAPEQPLSQVGSFFPFSHGITRPGVLLASSFTLNTSFLPGEALLDSQSLLNAPDWHVPVPMQPNKTLSCMRRCRLCMYMDTALKTNHLNILLRSYLRFMNYHPDQGAYH
jgi:myotubularin-related protein 10/11/12